MNPASPKAHRKMSQVLLALGMERARKGEELPDDPMDLLLDIPDSLEEEPRDRMDELKHSLFRFLSLAKSQGYDISS